MMSPDRRVMLWPVNQTALEIVVLGNPFELASFVAELLSTLGEWPGFDSVTPLAMGAQLVGFRVHRSANAVHDDPIAEAMLAMRRWPLQWSDANRCGMVARW